ncbi:unnamed protein product [Adineta steineri]|uniref:protein-tyrosine-phosphatase n=1 Tax=Adineta steineri TaxID=433720 RepID=A0A816DZ07_9BILA|nr:unnamed protein product [Adineta steineri]CAF1642159.1 unnamed protein product [Adineta steineri]
MSYIKQFQSTGTTNLNQILAAEARLGRLHRLFKTHFNVTEPSLILEPYLFLGNCISAHDTNRLTKLGIRYILNVAIRDVEVCPYYTSDVRTLTIDLRDDDRENILRAFDQAFAFIDEARRAKSRVLVHCSHGQSRSPAIVLGYLMRTYNVSLEQCLIHVVKARPCVLPNDGFLKQLILYDRFLVDRRRQRDEAVARNAVNVVNITPPPIITTTITTEIPIPIQQKPANAPPLTAPIILAPPQYPTVEPSKPPSMSSIDSSSLGKTSSLRSSTSADSIHVVPIQVQSKALHLEQIEPVRIKQSPVRQIISAVKETPNNINQLREKVPIIDLIMESNDIHHVEISKKRQSVLISNIVKRSSSEAPRSHPAHLGRTQVTYFDQVPYSQTIEEWDVITHYPANYRTSNEQPQGKYITEIYDKATKRFIPATC